MITTCLPTSSLILQKSKHTFISPVQKVLIEILYLQFFTFPLLSWKELKQEVLMILRRLTFCLSMNHRNGFIPTISGHFFHFVFYL